LRTRAKPDRVILSMPPVAWRLAREMRFDDDGAIDRVVLQDVKAEGEETVSGVELVLYLRRPVRVRRAFALRPGDKIKSWRLVIDLIPVSREEFER
jgi:hypothetical protein